jgi:hypothetical protein
MNEQMKSSWDWEAPFWKLLNPLVLVAPARREQDPLAGDITKKVIHECVKEIRTHFVI